MISLSLIILAAVIPGPQANAQEWNKQLNALLAQGKYNDAIRAGREAVCSARISFGPEHPATAMMVRNIAVAYERAGYYYRAEQEANRALSILSAAFGSDDVSLTPVLNVLVETYASQRRFSEAQQIGARAVAIGPDAGLHYATALQNLGAILEAERSIAAAERYYRQPLQARTALLPPNHPYVQETRAALARVARMEASTRTRKLPAAADAAFAQ